MLHVRYCAFFPVSRSESGCVELLLSLVTLENKVLPYLDLQVVLYTSSLYRASYVELLCQFSFTARVIALDVEFATEYTRWESIAAGIQHKAEVDRRCIVRMLADFHILPRDSFRLLIGTDIFFLDVPQELLSFVWQRNPQEKVRYMVDHYSFAGVPYQLRYFHPSIFEGLVGDFYCMAPGVQLEESAISGCLKMIDDWPLDPPRWKPAPLRSDTHACEQQAAAILLEPFGGQPLPAQRYSHMLKSSALAVLHGHSDDFVAQNMDRESLRRTKEIFEACM